ncbi:hypothetical protein NQZ68_026463 [Dissostichus eleginoides]|nr:hypothetical protein NQZ68_041638 [Dissostichus eleginoides]KAI9523521.1 hypothetical protein NQZ68_026463 [Dissostichus eleginoides]
MSVHWKAYPIKGRTTESPVIQSSRPVLDKGDTDEKTYPYLKNIGFPSVDNEVAGQMIQPLSLEACEVPQFPSPPPAETVPDMASLHKAFMKSMQDLSLDDDTDLKRVSKTRFGKETINAKNMRFPSLGDDTESGKHPKMLPPRVEGVQHVGDPQFNHPDLSNIRFPAAALERLMSITGNIHFLCLRALNNLEFHNS